MTLPPIRHLTLTVCAALGAARAGAAPPSWLEVKSSHFTVITNSSEKQGRRVAWQFEQIRAALVHLWPWARIDLGRPFVVFAVRDEETLRTLGPQYWEGKRYRPASFWVGSRDRNFIALRTDLPEPDEVGANPYQSAYWCYAASVFDRSFPRPLPAWYSRGIAEVMSNTIVRDKELHVGRPIRDRVELMRERYQVPLNEFLAADRRSHWLTQEMDVRIFDAQAWALVHYLMFGEKGANLGRVDRFSRLLVGGADADVALREAFGEMQPYYDGMRLYVQRSLFTYARVPVSLDTRAEAYASRPLSAGESAVLRGEFLVAMSRPVEARTLAAEAAKADASLPGPWEIEAELLDSEDHRDEARTALAKAAAAGSTRARVYYRLAQLEWTQNADKGLQERLADRLEKARTLEPDRADTLSFLAEVRTEMGQPEEGVRLARRSVEIEPAEAYHRLALARALWALQRPDEAVQFAKTALQAADSEAGRQRAQSFLDFATRAASARSAPAVSYSAAPSPADASVKPGQGVRMAIDSKAGVVAACFEKRDDVACGEAVSVLDAACGSGQAVACRSLGSLYDGGFGVAMNKSRAATAYERACRSGDKSSCARLAVLQAQGQGVARDTAQALSTLQRLCAEKVDDACIGWALLLAAGSGDAERAKARQLLQEACDRGSDEGCRLLKSWPR
jgi:TPR repeat protein